MTEQPPIVIQILGLGHSGSTLLETLLWEAFGVLALGEISAVLRQKKGSAEGTDDICSCGTQLESCDFWSPIIRARADGHMSKEQTYEFYAEVLKRAKAHGAYALTDSSPSQHVLPVLQRLEQEGRCRLKVVYLTRLPQGWIVLFRRMCQHVYRGVQRWFYSNSVRVALHWYRENLRCIALADSLKISYLAVSYEQLALDTRSMLNAIREFAELTPVESPAKPDLRHISYSHRTKFTTLSIKDIVYDTGWFADWGAQFAVLVLPRVRRLARTLVPLPRLPKKQ